MLFCENPIFEIWSPDFAPSGQSSPMWTRVRCGGVELCNSLESTAWTANPVQVQLCDACGTPGCASGGYVHISVIEDLVLWTRPQTAESMCRDTFGATATERFGFVAFPTSIWDRIRAAAHEVPDIPRLSHSDGHAIYNAWVAGRGRPNAPDELVRWLQSRLLAADTLEVADAIEHIAFWVNWFQQRSGVAVDMAVRRLDDAGATLEKLYFDGPGIEDWAALVRHGHAYLPTLGPDHVLLPHGTVL